MANNPKNLKIVSPYSDQSRAPGQRVSFQFWRQPVYELSDGTYWHPGSDGPPTLAGLDSPWSYLYLGIPSTQNYTPGKATVRVRSARAADVKKGSGFDGGHVAFHGVPPRRVEIDLLIWTPEQLRILATQWPTLFPQAYKGNPPAYDVQHPMLSLHGIRSLQFDSGEGPDVDRDGRGTFRMTAWEFLQPGKKNATKTNTEAIGSLLDVGAVVTTSSGFALPGSDTSNLGPK